MLRKFSHKCLKDRRERELSAEDIVHYGKVVSALGETIHLMAVVDEVIRVRWRVGGEMKAGIK